jgi:hypothetical protein
MAAIRTGVRGTRRRSCISSLCHLTYFQIENGNWQRKLMIGPVAVSAYGPKREDSPCQLGAVHTRPVASVIVAQRSGHFRGRSGLAIDVVIRSFLTHHDISAGSFAVVQIVFAPISHGAGSIPQLARLAARRSGIFARVGAWDMRGAMDWGIDKALGNLSSTTR